MKQCSVCQEEFADKFSFCPVDGTPLNGHASLSAISEETATLPTSSQKDKEARSNAVLQQTVAGAGAAPESSEAPSSESFEDSYEASEPVSSPAYNNEYHLTIIEDRS